jgi:mono/diheme cytochrome c family protein
MRETSANWVIGVLALAILLLPLIWANLTQAQSWSMSHIEAQGGEAIYKEVCQGCHMPDAKGASGAGMYPALAANPKLASKAFPVFIVINGLKAMPSFGNLLSDRQIADVVGYTRTHFGNAYPEVVTPDDVKALRPKTSD